MTKALSCIILILGLTVLLTSCSEEKKREAAKLEAQLNGDTSIPVTTETVQYDSVHDSLIPKTVVETLQTQGQTTLASDVDSQKVDSTTIPSQNEPPTGNQKPDSVADVNAIPEEAGQISPSRMPAFVEDAFTVQVSSTPSEEYARSVLDSFKVRGYDAYISSVSINEKNYYRVRIGHFSSRSQAQQTSAEINGKFGLQSWVDKITK
jgi:cell division septation protein DedD